MSSKGQTVFQGEEHDCYYDIDPRQNPELASALTGLNAVVAGAGRGIGRACSQFLTYAGVRSLTLVALEADELEATAASCQSINSQLLVKTVACDVCDAASVEAVLAAVDTDFGGVDVLLMNAGRPPQWLPTAVSDPGIWWSTVAVSLQGAFHFSRYAIPAMQRHGRGGRIIFTSSAGAHSNHGMASYTIGKLGMVRLAEILHQENFKEHGIKTFSFNPGCVRTRFMTDFEDFLKAEDGSGINSGSGGTKSNSTSYLVPGVPGEKQSAETVMRAFSNVTFDTPELAAGLVTVLAAGKLDFMSGRYIDASRNIAEYIAEKDKIQTDDLHRVKLHLADRYIPTSDF
ncbi:hypothetical protein SBRCBS47491_004738 [Sporothrix bragantina]|uniref:Uncharacterized protein n=1 Tax=Sporothrix bragantina TaxID=671064 RepID=A0ABP0BR26_9PEZI